MPSTTAPVNVIRKHAELLFESIGITRIIVVDDEYSAGRLGVEELIGICTELSEQVANLPLLAEVDFDADQEIWVEQLRRKWPTLNRIQQAELVAGAVEMNDELNRASTSDSADEQETPDDAASDVASVDAAPDDNAEPQVDREKEHLLPDDTRAAEALEVLLRKLNKCTFETLSLSDWEGRKTELLEDEHAQGTVILFDRDFQREKHDSENEGFELVRAVLGKDVGFCGLITHTVPLGGEYEAWERIAEEQQLNRDRFVVIAKERLTGDSPDHYSFLRMVRLAALSRRCAAVKSAAWRVFEKSVEAAKAAVEGLSVLDFDQIVLASSRREGVWEPDTLFRVFGVLFRREARQRQYGDVDADMPTVVSEARRVGGIPEKVAVALGEERPSREALRFQRFETFESDETLSRYCLPIELGDIFEGPAAGRRYILLTQPCDLMVRNDGKRSYDDKGCRSGALVELLQERCVDKVKDSWSEVPFYDEATGEPAYADFARTHQVLLAVLDLCALRKDGAAEIEIGTSCPAVVIEPWRRRHERLQKIFQKALNLCAKLESKQVKALKLLALPVPSLTVRFPVSVDGQVIRYDLKRVMRLRQPRSGALLTAFAQYQARAAFEHPFGHRLAMLKESTDSLETPEGSGAAGEES